MKTINSGPVLEDRLVSVEYPYESKEESSIAKMLGTYGIPFFYKQPTLVIENGKRCIEYADFFLPTYNGLAIDYIIESNSAIYRRKKNIYQDNQIPAVLITRKDMAGGDWQKKLYNVLIAQNLSTGDEGCTGELDYEISSHVSCRICR